MTDNRSLVLTTISQKLLSVVSDDLRERATLLNDTQENLITEIIAELSQVLSYNGEESQRHQAATTVQKYARRLIVNQRRAVPVDRDLIVNQPPVAAVSESVQNDEPEPAQAEHMVDAERLQAGRDSRRIAHQKQLSRRLRNGNTIDVRNKCLARIWCPKSGGHVNGFDDIQCSRSKDPDSSCCSQHTVGGGWFLGLINQTRPENPVNAKNILHTWASENEHSR